MEIQNHRNVKNIRCFGGRVCFSIAGKKNFYSGRSTANIIITVMSQRWVSQVSTSDKEHKPWVR